MSLPKVEQFILDHIQQNQNIREFWQGKITQWRSEGKTEDEVANAQKTEQNIEILEMDELYTYIKKNQKLLANKENPRRKLEFGLLLIGTKWKLLHFISDQEPKLQPKEYWKSQEK